MPSVAEQLRTAREAQGLSVYDVAETTKIKTDHVRALEEGNYDYFAAPVYIRGFVRTYGKLLHLEETQLMHELELELSKGKFSAPPSLTGPERGKLDDFLFQLSRVNWAIVLPVLVLVVVVSVSIWGYRTWREYKATDPLAHLGPGKYTPAVPPPGETVPLPTPPPPASTQAPARH